MGLHHFRSVLFLFSSALAALGLCDTIDPMEPPIAGLGISGRINIRRDTPNPLKGMGIPGAIFNGLPPQRRTL